MEIRLETPADYREVENLTREAFWNVYRPGCKEHFVLNRYRGNPDFIPELDFVMEEEGKIIGHVMFSKAELILNDGSRKPSWTFGPISVHPDYQRKGYGLQMLRYAMEEARNMGVGFLCMEGNIDFYSHAGFDLASKRGIHYDDFPKEDAVPFFLARELIPGWLGENGVEEATYFPPKGYFVADEDPEAFAAFDAAFPAKEKLRIPGQLGYDGVFMETERILLRPWRENDAAALFKYASDPEVGPRAGWPPHRSEKESRDVIRTIFHNDTTWAICLKENGEPVGAMGYAPCDGNNLPSREGEPLVGYWVGRPHWNQGICTEALQLMIDHVRKETEIPSFISSHFLDNPASGRVMEKCGFVPTGETCVDRSLAGSDSPMRVLRCEIRRP